MRLAIMQPYLFPYIGYFQLISAVDTFVLYDDVQYTYRSWINRNRIITANGPHLFTFPIKKGLRSENINQKYFTDAFPFIKDKFLKKLRHSYAQAPHYKETLELLNHIFSQEEKNLSKFISKSLLVFGKYLKIKTPLVFSSALKYNRKLKGPDRISEIAKVFEAKIYINSIGGVPLYSKDYFVRKKMKLFFLKTNQLFYNQLRKDFIPDLSIIDVLMFNSPKQINTLLNKYKLI